MLLTRVITAVVLLLILVAAAYAGDHVLNAVLAIGYGITLAEWLKLTKLSGAASYLLGAVFAVAGAALALAAPDANVFGGVYLALQLAVACVWLAVTAVCYNARNRGFGVSRSAATILAFAITAATWLAVWQFLRLGSWPLLISVFMIVWLADACAYFAGRLFGKNRMAPAISPKKTWEGVAGGLVSVFVVALAAYQWLPHDMVLTSILIDKAGFAAGLLMLLVLVAVSVAGDLFESSLKRQAGVKDSGRLLPGHGGFYDRLDSSLAVFPTAAAMLMII
mgnify:CR=1 FL=1